MNYMTTYLLLIIILKWLYWSFILNYVLRINAEYVVIITGMSHDCHGIWNHQQLNCLKIQRKYKSFTLLTLCDWNPLIRVDSALNGPIVQMHYHVNTLGPRQDGRHFRGAIFKCISLNENIWISIKISLKLVPKGPINNILALVQILAWRPTGDKPLSEAMMA